MLASSILSYSDFLKDSKEPLELRKAIVAKYQELKECEFRFNNRGEEFV